MPTLSNARCRTWYALPSMVSSGLTERLTPGSITFSGAISQYESLVQAPNAFLAWSVLCGPVSLAVIDLPLTVTVSVWFFTSQSCAREPLPATNVNLTCVTFGQTSPQLAFITAAASSSADDGETGSRSREPTDIG